jgi:hypothetical protein
MITQYISPYKDGARTISQFFADSRELWIITQKNGSTTILAQHALGDKFESVIASMDKVVSDDGWGKSQQQVASMSAFIVPDLSLTKAEKEILLHRLTRAGRLAKALSSSEITEGTSDAESDARVAERHLILQDKALRLCAYVENNSALPFPLDHDDSAIVVNCIEGSTWFTNEGCSDQTAVSLVGQRRAAEALASKVSAAVGCKVAFPNQAEVTR